VVLLDVREPFEWDIAHIEGSRLIPLGELPARLRELEGHADIVTFCHHGSRARRAAELLRAAGFSKVRSMRGGIDAWSAEVEPSLPRY
jgi:rhodanese-related sulfurtransferase